MKISIVSLNQIWEDKESNIRLIENLMFDACRFSPNLVIFPEMTLTGFTMKSYQHAEKFNDSPTVSFFSNLAEQYHCNIAFGLIVKTDSLPTNNLVIVSEEGSIISRYEKVHPFSYSDEDKYYSKGNEIVITKICDINIGNSICYDLRFPELFQALSKTCTVCINIANWPERRVADWKLLLHSRALENQFFMIGVNRTGVDGKGLPYAKSSMVISPRGQDIEPIRISDTIDFYEIDSSEALEYRNSFPVKNDRQIDLYKTIL